MRGGESEFFADVVGFIPLSEQLDPEEVGDLIRPAIDIMAEEIHTYEGTIAQFLGDGLMALFGAPLAHEDAPHRALYAALAIQRRLGEYAEELSPKGIQFRMRIGVNTGLVIVGRIGDDLTMEYTALGDTVNLASRMESAAEPGTMQIAESTYRLTEGYFDFEDLGEISVKGKEQPVHAWRVLRALPTRGRVAASQALGLSPFVGRERELQHLLTQFRQARDGSGQVVGMVGEPGVGKSRLLLQFRELLPADEYTYLEGGCIHYGEAVAYLPILDILRNYFDITEGENEEESKQKMSERVSSLNGHLSHLLSPLEDILSIVVDDESYLSLEPAERRERVFEAIRYLFMAESQRRPLILAIEDLHWIDKTSEEFLAYFIEGMSGANIFLLLLYRPEYTATWTSKTYYRQILVDQLSERSSTELVKSILTGGRVSSELSRFIIQKAAGNPLFIEEMTRGLLESGSILKDSEHYIFSAQPSAITVPDTVQGIIASRLDRLSEDLKETMQVAAVIGREFSLRLLQEVTGISKPLKSSLMQLQSLEFVYEKTLFPEPEYIFKHALTQEVVYGSLLLKRRKEIHGSIGRAIEGLYPDNLDDFYETLAYHYSRSEDTGKSLHYLKLSGDKAAKDYANWEAINYYREAIRLLDTLPDTKEREKKKLKIYLSIWSPMTFLNYPEGSLDLFQEAERLAEELGDEKSLVRVYRRLGLYHTLQGDNLLGLKYSEKSFDVAEKLGLIDDMARGANEVLTARNLAGDCLKVADITRRALGLIEGQHKERDLFAGGFNVYSQLVGWSVTALGILGEIEEARAVYDKGMRNASEIGDEWGMGWIEMSYGAVLILLGDGEELIEHMQRGIECIEETGIEIILGCMWSLLGEGCIFLDRYEEALDHTEKGLRLQEETGVPALLPLCHWNSAFTCLAAGRLEDAKRHAEEALRMSRDFKQGVMEPTAMTLFGRIIGEADLARTEIAVEHIREGISLAEEKRFRPWVALGCLFLGEILEMADRGEEALENLKKAEKMYQEMGVPPDSYWLTHTREALARLAQQME